VPYHNLLEIFKLGASETDVSWEVIVRIPSQTYR
jgi:hypothetical protein